MRKQSLILPTVAVLVGAWVTLAASNSDERSKASQGSALDSAEIADLRGEVMKLAERERIRDVYVRYGRGIDRLDERLYRSSFWPDAQINYATESNTVDDHWNNHMIKGFKQNVATWGHIFTNQAIDIQGDVAHVETYLTVFAIPKVKTGKEVLFSGRYIDRLDRRNGEWRVAVREFLPHFIMNIDTDAAEFENIFGGMYKNATSKCARDTLGRHDTSYVRPLNARKDRGGGPPCADSKE